MVVYNCYTDYGIHCPLARLQHHTQMHQSRVIGAVVIDGSLQLPHRLWNPLPSCPAAAPHAKASVSGRVAAGTQGKAVSLSLTLQQHKQRHQPLAYRQQERKKKQRLSPSRCSNTCKGNSLSQTGSGNAWKGSTCLPLSFEPQRRKERQCAFLSLSLSLPLCLCLSLSLLLHLGWHPLGVRLEVGQEQRCATRGR